MPIVRPRQHISPIFLLVAALLTAVLLPACSKSELNPAPTVLPITASEFVDRSQTAMGDLKSFEFKLTHDSGFTTLSGALQLTTASGAVAPNGLDLEAAHSVTQV